MHRNLGILRMYLKLNFVSKILSWVQPCFLLHTKPCQWGNLCIALQYMVLAKTVSTSYPCMFCRCNYRLSSPEPVQLSNF